MARRSAFVGSKSGRSPGGCELLETALHAAGMVAWELDLATERVHLDGRALRVLGLRRRTWSREELLELVHPEDRPAVHRSLTEHLSGLRPLFQAAFRFVPREGEIRWIEARARVVREGGTARVIGTVYDATERLQNEHAMRVLLRNAHETGEVFFESLVQSLAEVTGAKHTAVCELVGTDRARTVARWADGAPAPDIEYALAGTPCENVLTVSECHFADGAARRFPKDAALREVGIVAYIGVPLRAASGVVIGLIHVMHDAPLRDFGLLDRIRLFAVRASAELERLQAERALRSAELRFRTLLEGLNEGVLLTDVEGIAQYANPQFEQVTGFRHEELGQQPAHKTLFATEDWPAARQRLRRRLEGECETFVTELVRSDGERRWVSFRESPFRDEAGDVVGILAALEDITDQVRAEAEVREAHDVLESRVRERTAELQAMNRELESFSYSVSHDLRAPLRSINGFGRILEEEYGHLLEPEGRDCLRRIVDAARRMGDLIDDILELSRTALHELQHREVNLSSVARHVAEQLASGEPNRRVAWRIAPGLGVYADPTLMAVLLENLLGNAWKFTQRVSEPIIEFGCLEGPEGPVFFVRDNGAGFDMAFKDRLFHPFQRLHDARLFPGTGIGLATVQRVVSRHGGTIWAEGAPDRGATFFFTIGSPSEPKRT